MVNINVNVKNALEALAELEDRQHDIVAVTGQQRTV
jgi:hypothetical protein